MDETDVKRIISRLVFIKSDLEAISRIKMDGEMMKIVEEMDNRIDSLKELSLNSVNKLLNNQK